jgi:hypothetical protein
VGGDEVVSEVGSRVLAAAVDGLAIGRVGVPEMACRASAAMPRSAGRVDAASGCVGLWLDIVALLAARAARRTESSGARHAGHRIGSPWRCSAIMTETPHAGHLARLRDIAAAPHEVCTHLWGVSYPMGGRLARSATKRGGLPTRGHGLFTTVKTSPARLSGPRMRLLTTEGFFLRLWPLDATRLDDWIMTAE